MKTNHNVLRSGRCSVPAPSVSSRVSGRMAIAWQLRGKGGDRNAAEPDQNIISNGQCRTALVTEDACRS